MIDEEAQNAWLKQAEMKPGLIAKVLEVGFEFLVLDEKRSAEPENVALVWKKDVFKLQDALAGVPTAPVVQIPTTEKDPFSETRVNKSKACYVLRATTPKTWAQISKETGVKINNVFAMAQSYAKSRGLPFPPQRKAS
jgi:hypothetical protein